MVTNSTRRVYVPEILPLHVRAKGTAVGISSNWLWNFFVSKLISYLEDVKASMTAPVYLCANISHWRGGSYATFTNSTISALSSGGYDYAHAPE